MSALYYCYSILAQPEDVQYMKFDEKGNLYLYEPGAGMSGEPKRVIEFGSDEVIYAKSENNKDFSRAGLIDYSKVHRMIPSRGAVVMNACDRKLR